MKELHVTIAVANQCMALDGNVPNAMILIYAPSVT